MSVTSTLSSDGEELVIKVEGSFDHSVFQAFHEALALDGEGCSRYVVDLQNVSSINSSALGMLLLLRDRAGGESANVRLVNFSSDVEKILAISNFSKLFQLG